MRHILVAVVIGMLATLSANALDHPGITSTTRGVELADVKTAQMEIADDKTAQMEIADDKRAQMEIADDKRAQMGHADDKKAQMEIAVDGQETGWFALIENSVPVTVVCDTTDERGVDVAVGNLAADFALVCGNSAQVMHYTSEVMKPSRAIIVGTINSPLIKGLAKRGLVDMAALNGKNEKYVISFADNALPGIGEAMIIAGSDRRGAIYGVYEVSEQIGVTPWTWWADVPVVHNDNLYIKRGTYTAGEPAVKYRGIFLNDEAPCLTSWVKNYFGTNYGGHEFYAKVFELILRLRGNFMWPAMWGWAFYADDALNSEVADHMGVVMGTSHHEPMARNHQEYARHRGEYGPWNYNTNQERLDKFFADGIDRMRGTEDVVTIGMRGDGDEAMSAEADLKLLEKVIKNQRKIISKVTGRPAKETPQVWALYKEVLEYYEKGLRAPDDVILLLCDDNWGDVRRLPNAKERRHPGGWGMYYHVDYVGAPRNTKWLNVTPIQNMWEQLTLTYEYGVDKLWVLNVGDLKPMEYPITLFLDMAWDPTRYEASTLMEHPQAFCKQLFGDAQGPEAARLLNLYSKYAGRVTAEMLDWRTYNIDTDEWRQVRDEFMVLEAEALRQYVTLDAAYRDAYKQLILFPIQAMANVYDLYYSVAMNHKLHAQGDPQCNKWAERAEAAFARDAKLMSDYNENIAGGKWRGMMTQKHIGYTSWNDDFPADRMPPVYRLDKAPGAGGYVFTPADGVVVIEAEHFHSSTATPDTQWTIIPDMGRTLSGVTLMPRLPSPEGAELTYKIDMGAVDNDTVDVHIVVKSTLAFSNLDGHRYTVGFEGTEPQVVNFNHNLNEEPRNIYTVFYPTVASRVVESVVRVPVTRDADGVATLSIRPLDPGIVFEKVVIDLGGYTPQFLFGKESRKVKSEE